MRAERDQVVVTMDFVSRYSLGESSVKTVFTLVLQQVDCAPWDGYMPSSKDRASFLQQTSYGKDPKLSNDVRCGEQAQAASRRLMYQTGMRPGEIEV